MAKRFQIRDATFGLALYEAETAQEALLEYVADRAKGAVRAHVRVTEGEAEITLEGVVYRAVPLPVATGSPGG